MPSIAAGSSVVKNPPTSTGGTRNSGSIPGAGRSFLEKEMATYSNMLAWEISQTTSYCPWGHKESDTTEHTYLPGPELLLPGQ